jgi:hypothetical protein
LGLELETFRLAVYCLNHYAAARPTNVDTMANLFMHYKPMVTVTSCYSQVPHNLTEFVREQHRGHIRSHGDIRFKFEDAYGHRCSKENLREYTNKNTRNERNILVIWYYTNMLVWNEHAYGQPVAQKETWDLLFLILKTYHSMGCFNCRFFTMKPISMSRHGVLLVNRTRRHDSADVFHSMILSALREYKEPSIIFGTGAAIWPTL